MVFDAVTFGLLLASAVRLSEHSWSRESLVDRKNDVGHHYVSARLERHLSAARELALIQSLDTREPSSSLS